MAPKSFFSDIAMFRLIFTFCICMVTLVRNKPAKFQTDEKLESFYVSDKYQTKSIYELNHCWMLHKFMNIISITLFKCFLHHLLFIGNVIQVPLRETQKYILYT